VYRYLLLGELDEVIRGWDNRTLSYVLVIAVGDMGYCMELTPVCGYVEIRTLILFRVRHDVDCARNGPPSFFGILESVERSASPVSTGHNPQSPLIFALTDDG